MVLAGSSKDARVSSKVNPREANSILLILMGSLGDVARGMFLPVELKRLFQAAELCWLVDRHWEPLVRLNSAVDRTISIDRRRFIPSFSSCLRRLTAENFNLTIDAQRIFRSGLCSLFSGAKFRIGFHPKNSKELNFLFNSEHLPFRERSEPKIENYQDFIRMLGGTPSDPLDFGLGGIEPAKLLGDLIYVTDSDYIVFVMGSSKKEKDWPAERYVELARLVVEHSDLKVLLVGGKAHIPEAESVSEATKSPRVINLVGKTSIQQLVGLIKGASLGVGPDSGPAHISAALKVPFLTLFGPSNAERVVAYQLEHLVIKAGPSNRMDLISADTVWRKAESVLTGVKLVR